MCVRSGRFAISALVGLLVLLSAWILPARAAQITVYPDPEGKLPVIGIEGELFLGDEAKFAEIALTIPNALVGFNSPGGNVRAGIEIGRAIRLKGFLTYVPGGSMCASACGYAWLAGVERFMERDSKIGFHAAYIERDGTPQESGSANALVGAYLNGLGLSENAVFYITNSAPNSMTWLTPDEAAQVGINVRFLDAPPKTAGEHQDGTATASDQIQRLPGSDIFGHDLPGMPLKNVSVSDCEDACQSDNRCQAYTFNKKYSACFLKSAGERVFRNLNAEAGYKASLGASLRISKIAIFEGTDLPGGDLAELKQIGFGDCSDACEGNSRCKAFTYHGKSKTCWLKADLPQALPSKRLISGVKQ